MTQTTASSYLIYGVSDSRKTTQIRHFARFVYEMTGRKTRVLSVETSGADRLQPAVDAGLILPPFWLKEQPVSAIGHLAKGDWPHAVDSARNLTNDPAKAVGAPWVPTPAEDWEEVGGLAVEGTKTIANFILRTLANEGRGIGREALAVMVYEEDGIKIGQVAKNHYNDAQQHVLRMITETPRGVFSASKGKVQYVLFTGHEARGEEDGAAIYGVGTVGKATVKDIPGQVGTLLHHEIERKTGRVWCYYRSHPDFENPMMMWTCKANLPDHPKVWEAVEKKWPHGAFELTFDQTLYDYMKFQHQAKQLVADELAKSMRQSDAIAEDISKETTA